MATQLKEVDAVCIGVGWTGSILARELTKAGLKVVGLERGANRSTARGFRAAGHPRRTEIFGPPGTDPGHPARDRDAAPFGRRDGAADAPARLVPARRRGRRRRRALERQHLAHPADRSQTAQPSREPLRQERRSGGHDDPGFPVSYAELEPYYDRFEKLLGVSGKAGNLRGQKIDGGNVFEGPRADEYPNPPLAQRHGRRHHGKGLARASAITRSRRPPRI